jgi:hypothetical protein
MVSRLEFAPSAAESLVGQFDNAGEAPRVGRARVRGIGSGAMFLTSGIRASTLSASITGGFNDPTRLCILRDLPDLPNPDINGDGNVDLIDRAFILAY